jgi:acetyl-CoA C-acetyltransferase
MNKDESIRSNISKELLLKAQTVKLIDRTNTADFHDGAGIILLGNKEFGKSNSLKPIAKISQVSFVGLDPNCSPAGAILASKPVMDMEDFPIELFEICESYAAKPIAFAKEYAIPESRLNILGSNLAMGHPFAASGIINVLNLYLALKGGGYKRGLVSAGIAGGLGASIVLEIEK